MTTNATNFPATRQLSTLIAQVPATAMQDPETRVLMQQARSINSALVTSAANDAILRHQSLLPGVVAVPVLAGAARMLFVAICRAIVALIGAIIVVIVLRTLAALSASVGRQLQLLMTSIQQMLNELRRHLEKVTPASKPDGPDCKPKIDKLIQDVKDVAAAIGKAPQTISAALSFRNKIKGMLAQLAKDFLELSACLDPDGTSGMGSVSAKLKEIVRAFSDGRHLK